MFLRQYSLDVEGIVRFDERQHVPETPGIYFVYDFGIYPLNTPIKLLYIGESGDLRYRLTTHEDTPNWVEAVGEPESLGFSYACVSSAERQRIEAALIHRHKPPMNRKYVNEFPFLPTKILLSGRTDLLHNNFTVTDPYDFIRRKILESAAKRDR